MTRDRHVPLARIGWCTPTLALLLLLACGKPVPTAHPAKGPVPDRLDALREILTNYDALSAALARQDPAAINAMRTPDFSVDYPTGVHDTGFPVQESVRRFFWTNKPPITMSVSILAIDSMSSDRATLQVLQRSSRYQELAGKRRRVDHDVTQRETWVRTPSGWRLHHVGEIRDRHRWIDGIAINPEQPFDPDAPPYVPASSPGS
jgi:hypothetical protein